MTGPASGPSTAGGQGQPREHTGSLPAQSRSPAPPLDRICRETKTFQSMQKNNKNKNNPSGKVVNRRHTVVLQKKNQPGGSNTSQYEVATTTSASSPLFKHRGQAHSHLSLRRSARRQPQTGPTGHGGQARCTASPLVSPGCPQPRPQRKGCKAQLHTLPPASAEQLPALRHSRRSRSAVRGSFCSPWKAAQGSSARMVCNPGDPSAPLSPRSRSIAHSRPKTPHPRALAAAGGARATLGWRAGGRRCQGPKAECCGSLSTSHRLPGKWSWLIPPSGSSFSP